MRTHRIEPPNSDCRIGHGSVMLIAGQLPDSNHTPSLARQQPKPFEPAAHSALHRSCCRRSPAQPPRFSVPWWQEGTRTPRGEAPFPIYGNLRAPQEQLPTTLRGERQPAHMSTQARGARAQAPSHICPEPSPRSSGRMRSPARVLLRRRPLFQCMYHSINQHDPETSSRSACASLAWTCTAISGANLTFSKICVRNGAARSVVPI